MARTGFRYSLLKAAAGAALLVSMASGAASATEPEISFYPVQAWTSGSTPGVTAAGGAAQCFVQSEFNNHYIMRFDGSGNWVETLNVDFRQNVFETGKTYDVSLSVPGVESKMLSAEAARQSTLSIRLKGQKDFYKALSQSPVLDMKIEENHFRFYLTGFAAAAKNFERCMAGGPFNAAPATKTAAPQTADAGSGITPSPAPEAEIFRMNESIAYEQAETQNVPIQEVLPELPGVPEPDMAALAPIGAEAKSGTAVPSTAAEPSSRKRLSEQLAEDIANNPDIIAIDERPSSSREMLAMPPAGENENLLPAPTDPQATPVEKNEKVAALDTLSPIDREMDTDQADMSESKNGQPLEDVKAVPPVKSAEPVRYKTPEMKINREVAKAELDLTSETLDRVEPAGVPGGYGETISRLEDELQKLKTENAALNDELESALKESEHERLSISSENWNLEQATMQFNEAERQIKRLGQQIQKER
ncbi:MAG: hypothetical protein R3D66_06945, partial [Alphaproteobacteria bacterium]